MTMRPAETPATCPACGNLVAPLPIVFGLPGHELMVAEARGEIELAGCLVTERDPTHRCPACRASLERQQDGSYAVLH